MECERLTERERGNQNSRKHSIEGIELEKNSARCRAWSHKGGSRPQGAAVRTQIQDADVWNGNLALSVHKQNGP